MVVVMVVVSNNRKQIDHLYPCQEPNARNLLVHHTGEKLNSFGPGEGIDREGTKWCLYHLINMHDVQRMDFRWNMEMIAAPSQRLRYYL